MKLAKNFPEPLQTVSSLVYSGLKNCFSIFWQPVYVTNRIVLVQVEVENNRFPSSDKGRRDSEEPKVVGYYRLNGQ